MRFVGSARVSLALGASLVLSCAPLARVGPASQDPADGRPDGRSQALPGAPAELQVATLKTKSDLPPVFPTLGGKDDRPFTLPEQIPPGKTEVRPPQPLHLLSGRVTGYPARQVQALPLAGGRDFVADVDPADHTFSFGHIDPRYYQMALVGSGPALLIRKVVVIEPTRPVFIIIELLPDGSAAKVDGLTVPVEVRQEAPGPG